MRPLSASYLLLLLRRTATVTCTQHKMRPTVTDVAWSVCLSVEHSREPYETAKPIEVPLGLSTRVG